MNHKIFDRAYDKAARLKPGDPDPLFPKEREVLIEYINASRERIKAQKIMRLMEEMKRRGLYLEDE